MKPLSVYIHWPYCKSKCPYCDFFKIVDKNVDQQALIDTYISELDDYRQMIPDRKVRSIFFGGGTPSLIEPKHIARLIEHVDKLWPTKKNIEISLEANPNSEVPQMFYNLKTAGINRLSLGVQALNDADLKFLGRTHTLAQAYHSIENVLKNFDNHSIDLIYARPNQKIEPWFEELQTVLSFKLKHLSLYQLTIEEGTVFHKKGIRPLQEDKAADMYLKTVDFLRCNGYPRYEVSNFAAKKYESKHNKCYWTGDDYIGIGQSAHGRLKIKNHILALVDGQKSEALTPFERAEELVIMGLRLEEGINKRHFKQNCGLDFDDFINQKNLKKLVSNDFLINTAENTKATDKGFVLLDKLILELCS